MDLVSELAGSDPMKRIVDRVTPWWGRDFEKIAIATLNGVINSNIVNNAADMVYAAGVGMSGAAPTGGLDAVATLNAKQSMGDKANHLKLMVMHSMLHTSLQKQNLIQYIPNSRGEIEFGMYLGYRLIVTDNVPVVASGPDYIFTTYLSAPGILAYAESPPTIPVETFRHPEQGMGTGSETLYTRRQFAMTPETFTWNEAAVTGLFPTNAELANAANWTRKFPERKQTPFVAIRSKNG